MITEIMNGQWNLLSNSSQFWLCNLFVNWCPISYYWLYRFVLGTPGASQSSTETGMIRAPAPMMRCSKIMHMMRDLHPTLLSALEGIVDQVRITFFASSFWTASEFRDVFFNCIQVMLVCCYGSTEWLDLRECIRASSCRLIFLWTLIQ